MNKASFLSLTHHKKLRCEILDEIANAILLREYTKLLRSRYRKACKKMQGALKGSQDRPPRQKFLVWNESYQTKIQRYRAGGNLWF